LGLSFFFQSLFYHHHQILLHALSFWRGDLVIKRESAQDEKRKSSYSFSSAFLPPFFSALRDWLAGGPFPLPLSISPKRRRKEMKKKKKKKMKKKKESFV
jgi:hypothetical protein